MEVSKSKDTTIPTDVKEEEFVEDAEAEEEEEEEDDEEEEEEEDDEEDQEQKIEVNLFKLEDDEKISRKSVRYASDDWDDGFGKKDRLDEEEEEEEESEEEEEDEESFVFSVATVQSEISFVWEEETYKFERLIDTTQVEIPFKKESSALEVLDKVGLDRYLAVCSALNIAPMTKLVESLPTNEIDLTFRNLDTKEVKALCAALEVNNVVTRLLLRYNRFTPRDCAFIGYVLVNNESISYLDFTGCRIGPEGMAEMAEFLGKNAAVEVLILSKCNLQDEGLKSLSSALIRNDVIKKLDLSYNGLSEDSAEPLALVFKTNASITDLSLRYNNLYEPSAMKQFFAALATNPNLRSLDLSWNGLNGEEMAVHIAKFLKKNQSIQHLDLSDNRIEGKALLEIKKALPKSQTLEVLNIGKNPLSPDELEMLLNAAKASPNLRVLDLDSLWVNKSFVKLLNKIQLEKELEVNYEGVFSDYTVYGPDYAEILLKRAQFEAQKPKRKKLKKDFGHLMFNLGHKPLPPPAFMELAKKFKAKVSKELYSELVKHYTMPKTLLVDVVGMRKKYLTLFPDSTPAPPKPKKGKKGKGAGEVEEVKFREFDEEDEEEEAEVAPPVQVQEEIFDEEDEDEEEEGEYDEEEGEYDEEEEDEDDEEDDFIDNPFFAVDENLREFQRQHQRMSKFLNL